MTETVKQYFNSIKSQPTRTETVRVSEQTQFYKRQKLKETYYWNGKIDRFC